MQVDLMPYYKKASPAKHKKDPFRYSLFPTHT